MSRLDEDIRLAKSNLQLITSMQEMYSNLFTTYSDNLKALLYLKSEKLDNEYETKVVKDNTYLDNVLLSMDRRPQ